MPQPIDRRRLVRRHNPVLTSAHPAGVLTVGNGDIALTVDVSGLQTFPSFHELVPDPHRVVRDGLSGLPEQRPRAFDAGDFQIPLRTQSTWGWYETRPEREPRLEDTVTLYETPRGPVPYLDRMGLQRPGDPIAEEFAAGAWFHFNPRRAHLGRLALVGPDGTGPGDPALLADVRTELDLWTGTIHAAYVLDGEQVRVTTVADPREHRFAVRVESGLLPRGWGVAWVFDDQPDDLAAFELPPEQKTVWNRHAPGHWTARRTVAALAYDVAVRTTGGLREEAESAVARTDGTVLDVVVTLTPDQDRQPDGGFTEVSRAARDWWAGHWSTGAAISLDGSTDPRARELERRIVLSQYLTAVNCAGATPPAESGLTYNTWSGKFHLEMHWWHAAHFPLWGRGHLLERSLRWYHDALEAARETARRQGYRGARWPKQTDPSARESPSNIGVFLLWQQPHVIHLLELLRAEGRGEEFLREHYPLIEATAAFMADFAEERGGSYVLPPPLIPAQESYLLDRATNADPTFELAYWSWALGVANEWRTRLGLEPDEEWARVARNMRRPAVLPDGTYAALATPPMLVRKDHPSMLMALGWLPDTHLVDPATMAATLDAVWEHWDLQSSWGWDYPVMAMTAARLGDVGRALDALLLPSPKNVFLPNGHNPQLPGFLTIYLPANGGLLAAMAHIIAALERGAEPPDGWLITSEPAAHHQIRFPFQGIQGIQGIQR
ncbi:hypothetical protein ACU635_28380 [[Actinomadura] parvosata]|uniref:hypothetical protein n=1 Tax=[Actinomadura] parvosata TaxID=1955412 RepID=UPI00406C121F